MWAARAAGSGERERQGAGALGPLLLLHRVAGDPSAFFVFFVFLRFFVAARFGDVPADAAAPPPSPAAIDSANDGTVRSKPSSCLKWSRSHAPGSSGGGPTRSTGHSASSCCSTVLVVFAATSTLLRRPSAVLLVIV